MCVWFKGYPPIICYQLFLLFLQSFPGPISIGIDTNHSEIVHICSKWSEDVRVVLGLSSYYTDLKLTLFN